MKIAGTPLGRALRWSCPAVGLVAIVVLWNPPGDYWKTVEPPKAQCEAYDVDRLHAARQLTAEIYDQRKLARLIREPQNTFSNLPYAVFGLAILLAGRNPASRGLGLAGLLLGVGSGLYHASLLPEWRMVDILGVYAVLFGLVWLGINQLVGNRWNARLAWAGTVAVWAFAGYTGVHRNDVRWFGLKVFDSTYVFVASAATAGALALVAWARSTQRRIGGRAVLVVAIAAGISVVGGIGDRFGGFWAAPEAAIQGHSVWHVFGAAAMLAAYEVYAAAGFDRSTLKR